MRGRGVVGDGHELPTGAVARGLCGFLWIAELVRELQLDGAVGRVGAAFEQGAHGGGLQSPVGRDVGDRMTPHAGGQLRHGAGVGLGIGLALVDVGGVLEFVELFDLGVHLQLLERAAEEQRLEGDAGRLERRARLYPDLVGGGDGAVGGGAGGEKALRVGDNELVLGAQAEEGRAQLLRARGADIHLGGANEHAFHIGVAGRGVQAEQDLDERRVGEGGADRIGGGLVGPGVAKIDLDDGVAGLRPLVCGQERHDQDQGNQDKEHHQGGKAAKKGEQEGAHRVGSGLPSRLSRKRPEATTPSATLTLLRQAQKKGAGCRD